MSVWTDKQTEIIIKVLVSKPENKEVFTDLLLKGDDYKKIFKGKTDRGILAKALQLHYEAISHGYNLEIPPNKPKEPSVKPREARNKLYESLVPKLTAAQKKTEAIKEAIKKANEELDKRKAAATKAKATRKAKKEAAEEAKKAAEAA